MGPLFRQQAVEHATRRLNGTVVLATPLSIRLLGGLLALVVVSATVFAGTATYARKSTITGWLLPDQGLIRAAASAQGHVVRIIAKEGEVVTKGSRLAEISLSTETMQGNLAEVLAQSLERESEALKAKSSAQSERFASDRKQLVSRMQALGKEIDQARAQARLQQDRLELARGNVEQSEIIAKKGYLSQKEMNARKSALLETEQQLAAYGQQIAGLEKEKSDLESRLAALPAELASAEAEQRMAEAALAQRAADVNGRHSQVIVAPVDGVVAAIPVSVGQAVAPGSSIAVLVPKDGRLEAELLAPSRAAGFIREGQDVKLMLQAYPFQRFGALGGTVRSVSNTVLAPSEIAIPGLRVEEPVFRVRVAIERDSISAYGRTIQLQPGMLLTADVVLDRRSLIAWLFDPIYAAGRRL